MIARLDKVTVYVGSQEEAKTFWTSKIGFAVTYEQAMEAQNPGMVAHPSVIFGTWDIDKTWQEYKTKGVDLDEIQPMPYGAMFMFRDPDKNRYMVRQIG